MKKKIYDSQIGNILKSWGYNMKEVTIECDGFFPKFPDYVKFKSMFKLIKTNGLNNYTTDMGFGWRYNSPTAPIVDMPGVTDLSRLFYQVTVNYIDENFFIGLPDLENLRTFAEASNIGSVITKNVNIFKYASKKLKYLNFISGGGNDQRVVKEMFNPIAKQLIKFTYGYYQSGTIEYIEPDFFSIFDYNKVRSFADMFSGTRFICPLPEIWKYIPMDKCVSIKDEAWNLSNIPEGKINVYSFFCEDLHKNAPNWNEVPDIFKDTYVPPNK